jgi:peptidase MA superfamily protein
VVAAAIAVTGCSRDESVAPPRPSGDGTAARDLAAQHTLTTLVKALESRDAEEAAALATPAARRTLEALVANAQKLDLGDLSMRFVDDQAELSAAERSEYGEGAWPGTVEVDYRIAGWDAQPTRLEARFVFVTNDGRTLLAGVGGAGGRTPLWTTGPVTTFDDGRALVVTTGTEGQRYLDLAKQALVDVAKVLPGWHGKLVIEAPSSEEQLDQALAAPQDQYANIAAVTTTVDGSLVPGSPVHVFLNPRVFDDLGPRGAQVVVSHETTHVATDATFKDLPTWLLEGFADYVALAHAGIPVQTAAAQILARIRKQGVPDHLPTAAELDPTANGLGATYEEAWLATRFMAREYGEGKLVRLYTSVGNGETVADAFRKILGTSEAGFVAKWRADLHALTTGVEG